MSATFTISFNLDGTEYVGEFNLVTQNTESFYQLQAVHPSYSALDLPLEFHLRDGYVVTPSDGNTELLIAQHLEKYLLAHSG